MSKITSAQIPMRWIGPIAIQSESYSSEVKVPLATYETPLWPSTARGAKISRLCGGIQVTVVDESMVRSIILEASSATAAHALTTWLKTHEEKVKQVVESTSNFAKYQHLHCEVVANLVYLRLSIDPADASGHNMVTKAAEQLGQWLVTEHTDLTFVSVSGNACTDKKVSAINGILGRGKRMIAEITLSRDICKQHLRTTPEAIADLHLKKNLIGSLIAGSLRSANAHVANLLLAFYLATGQDAANIVEGSQAITHAVVKDNALYFSVTLPNIIVGATGNGKDLEFVKDNLDALGCNEKAKPGTNSRKLGIICAATVLCGELSLMAALSNNGELIRSHLVLERQS